ncbi:MAG: hypothetical protein DMG68_02765 [Acidobacteria bacterium]|nr:MAG: hypothetical protein DMG68_02765 [Acidobacteriota bacterium]
MKTSIFTTLTISNIPAVDRNGTEFDVSRLASFVIARNNFADLRVPSRAHLQPTVWAAKCPEKPKPRQTRLFNRFICDEENSNTGQQHLM